MKREITRREVLLDCLEILRQEWRLTSKRYNCLEPKEGMEEAFDDCFQKCVVLQQIIQALECEEVKAAIASFLEENPERATAQWQKDLMAGKQPDVRELERGTVWSSDRKRNGEGSGTPA